MKIELKPVAFVRNVRTKPIDDEWSSVVSHIILAPDIPHSALQGIKEFSHLEIIYYFDQVIKQEIVYENHPRGNTNYPKVGIFAQRKKDRPNQLGICTVELIQLDGNQLTVKYLDAIDGTPVLDIKPVLREFEPQSSIRQPEWATDLMKHYW
ncbi:tRNA (N6-threonylcarbamoyladenosine(37)-N6)-methyltransferase TrmO [Leptospira bouyouniensis]|uniref:tRNA (N6-threonylcarbamoyladenosine(37)-N6)-methyltransferase TrmO n=1 Tax=Leptospira bouyouniensis TaxID=2484911 RepID=A0A7I0HVR7_9LEPT|nr:tRNA (N6-threonylcarbamoyladenosine(37)-N6)-methyltransferase TrmO [Leptospira bouyouniensis]TGL08335.1 tRNA (N6-threonylcarbamoyladenosine(37)-N6)-methyltransferase TrmO [Leptospira bouyouniensis]TGM87247.1 tRNA (N6-threonylcarbamoyladenosine(37)-N6)-methyltransferase TrmO [Leptospira bouyouniensis]